MMIESLEGFRALSAEDQQQVWKYIRFASTRQRYRAAILQAAELCSSFRLDDVALRAISDTYALEGKALRGRFTKPTMDEFVAYSFLPDSAAPMADIPEHIAMWVMREHCIIHAKAFARCAKRLAGPVSEAARAFHGLLANIAGLSGGALPDGYVPLPRTYEDVIILFLSAYGEQHPLNISSFTRGSMAETSASLERRADRVFGRTDDPA